MKRIVKTRPFLSFLIVFSMILLFSHTLATYAAADSLVITIKVSPQAKYVYEQSVTDDRSLIRSILRSKPIPADQLPELPRAYLAVRRGNERSEYMIDDSWRVFRLNEQTALDLAPAVKDKLKLCVQRAEAKFYGEAVPWDQVRELFPKKTNAQVIDLETGLAFQVQRRAGSQHADVQPLTREDSRIMRTIYNGKWSWKRRAILIKVGDRSIAASMNGMPHGAGAIQGNDFPGHFCIHFEGSTTHRRRQRDPGHYLMIWKASGRLNNAIVHATPEQLVELFLAAVKAQDLHAAKLMLDHSNPQAVGEFLDRAKEVEDIRTVNNKTNPKAAEQRGDLSQFAEVPVRVSVTMAASGKARQQDLTFVVRRSSLSDRWKIDVDSVFPLLDSKKRGAAGAWLTGDGCLPDYFRIFRSVASCV